MLDQRAPLAIAGDGHGSIFVTSLKDRADSLQRKTATGSCGVVTAKAPVFENGFDLLVKDHLRQHFGRAFFKRRV